MKKLLVCLGALVAVVALSACSGSDYYKGKVRYVQHGNDCTYYADESSDGFLNNISDMDNEKKIVYHNTKCSDLYVKDAFGRAPCKAHKAFVPATKDTRCGERKFTMRSEVASDCGCSKPIARRYYIISAM